MGRFLVTLLCFIAALFVATQPTSGRKITCVFFRGSRNVYCRLSTSRTWRGPCKAVRAGGKGDAPKGRYAIGPRYTHPSHRVDWHNLYPKSRRYNIYYDYYRVNPETGRSHIAFHAGHSSLGCITVSKSCYRRAFLPVIRAATPGRIRVRAKKWGVNYNKIVSYIGVLWVV